jgi:Na+-driven multidrug efflux pump
VFWVSLGYAFVGMFLMVVNYISFVKKNWILAWITLACGILNIGLNYAFIQWNGALGAAKATAISYFISFLLTWFLAARVKQMPWFASFKR